LSFLVGGGVRSGFMARLEDANTHRPFVVDDVAKRPMSSWERNMR